jgi:hypothetical protein
MFHLVYVSSAVNLFSDEQLEELLAVSRTNNDKNGLTGMLLYVDGNFIQALEGEKDDVLATNLRIARDPRHRGMLTLLQGDIEQRNFPNWSMGYRRVGLEAGTEIPGYNDFLHQKADPAAQRSSALRLMEHFRSINR